MNSYADLRIAFGDDYEALCKHYITYGIYENRTMALKPVMTPAESQDSFGFDGIVYYYDANGNITSSYIYDTETGELLAFATFEYNANGDMTRADQYDADGTSLGHLEYSYGTDGGYTIKDYDADGYLMYTKVYDALDRNIKYVGQNGCTVEYTYAGDTEVISVEKTTLPDGDYYIEEYDTTTGKIIVQKNYAADGILSGAIYFTYSSDNKLVSEEYKDADGNRIHFVEYNENEQKIKFTYGNGDYYTYEYTADTIIEKYYYDDGTLSRTTVYDYDWNIISNT